MELIQVFFYQLWAYLLESAPYLLFGFGIAGIIHIFLKPESIKNLLGGGNVKTVIKAALVGVPLPLCSCSVIPTAVTIKKSGASNGATSAFLIATPESGVDSISLTYALMDLPMTILRPVAAFVSATFSGLLQNSFNDFEVAPEDVKSSGGCCKKKKMAETAGQTWPKKILNGIKYGYLDLVQDMSFWLAFGLIAGAIINTVVPEDAFGTLGIWGGKAVVLLIGVPFYICASASTPIAASLILKGMSPGNALILLLVGPATNVSNLAIIQKYIGKRGVMLNVFSIVFVAVVFSFLVDFYYSYTGTEVQIKLGTHVHADDRSLFREVATAVFLILLARGLWKEKIAKYFKR
ncbi:MAG: SO_0444 family Cu/Zn efflux transporter [Bacteriovoracaceae bacterium]|jgi:uncharacterized protein|nr:SO_0444 family Cu/Zn efflux transporter [Bacteriovoracaceae bacterium]